ncbi:MAG: TlpA family protein disulfide reductase [Gemmatimonadota bacterium]
MTSFARHRLLWLLAVVGLLTGCGEGGGEADAEPGAEGPSRPSRPAPAFALETLAGDTLTLASFAARPAVLMNFWASWCEPCKVEIPDLIALHQAYEAQGLQVLGVVVNDVPRDTRAFVAELPMPYPSVIATPAMLEAYRIAPWLPTTILISDGRIVEEWVGPRVRADFEYPIRVALGIAPPLDDVIVDEPEEGRPRGR